MRKKTIDPKIAMKGKSYVSGEEYKKMLESVTETDDDGDDTTITFRLAKTLRAEFKAKLASQQINMRDILTEFVKRYVNGEIKLLADHE